MIFSEQESGEQHGYYDGWLGDGCFHYTGEGQYGDQQMTSGNAAILSHRTDGRALRVFDGARGTVTYLDEFELDENEPFYRTDAPETEDGPLREVLVFRLRPRTTAPAQPNSKLSDIVAGPSVTTIPVEQLLTERMYVEPNREPYEAERREQQLVIDFETHLTTLGHELCRQKLLPSGETRPLLTDLYDTTTGTLIEAKGSVERNAIRMAIGQLADYKRFVDGGKPKHLALLVPVEPRADLCELLAQQGIEIIFRSGKGFSDTTGGALVGD